MLLTEVFNAPYEWKWTTTDRRYVQAIFYDKDNTPYIFTASARDIAPMDQEEELRAWEIDFVRKSKDGSYSWEITKTGDQHRILATVIDILRKLVKARKVVALMFSAKEPSRAKLYQRIVKSLLPNWFYEDTESFGANVVIYHPSQKERLHAA